ncbi:IKI3 family-domain-containing protein [Syncephalis fuscata]|nr:IKI3 family-domain-containing protein [Syncephalis fuscata]
MKNLALLTELSHRLPSIEANDGTSQSTAQLCLDTVNGRVYTVQCQVDGVVAVRLVPNVVGESNNGASINENDDNIVIEFPIETNDMNGDTASCQIVHSRYLAEYEMICIALSTGELYTAECVGHFESGIKSMAWSPDEELLIIVTGADELLLMTSEFTVITENPLHTTDEGEDKAVNVGWGKKETQFHGSLGKQAALTPSSVSVSSIKRSSDDYGAITVSWRGDGNYFACSSFDPRRGHRLVRVFNREGLLQNTSEPTDALSSCLNWRPSGNWITTSQRQPHRQVVLLFEHNEAIVSKICLWNADSTVLAIWLTLSNKQQVIQLWTTSNYKWYLKQSLELNNILDFQWDIERPLRLHLLTLDGYQCNQYVWDTAASPGYSAENASLVSVIDGHQLLLTPFKLMNVPPPMSAYSITTLSEHGPINHVTYTYDQHGHNDLTVQCQKRYVELYSFAIDGIRKAPRLVGSVELPKGQSWRHIYSIHRLQGDYILLALTNDPETRQDVLAFIVISPSNEEKNQWIIEDDAVQYKQLVSPVIRLTYDYHRSCAILEDIYGHIYTVNIDNIEDNEVSTATLSVNIIPRMRLVEPCPWISVLPSNSTYSDQIIGLSHSGKLYLNGTLINASCTSFVVHHQFLLYTTYQHELHVLPLSDLTLLESPTSSENKRKVERGAQLVTAHAHGVAVILQMPRGNLETIHPRAMVLASVAERLDSRDYLAAFIDCRRHRVDTNVLHVRHPQQFIKDLGEFVKQLEQVDYLNLFMSNLKPNLNDPMPMSPDAIATTAIVNSVNDICEAMIEHLTQLDEQKYLQTILISYIRKDPTDIVGALSVIRQLQQRGVMNAGQLGGAIQFISVMVDVKRLYDEALGMYDFDLVLMIVQNSHLDPREHIPFLNELKALAPWYRRFRIDDHLGRHVKAMENLWAAGEDYTDEWVAYVAKYQLFESACNVAASNPLKLKLIYGAQATYLKESKNILGAAQAYQLAHQFDHAIDCYLEANQWCAMFSIAHQQGYTRAQLVTLARKSIDNLSNERRYSDAATLADDYLQDAEMTVSLLISGGQWIEAGRKARLQGRNDLIETCVLPGLEEGVDRLIEDMETAETQLDKQYPRLLELRKEFLQRPIHLDEPNALLDDVEIQSGSTALTSQFSRFTLTTTTNTTRSGKSSRSKKREDRKKHRGKKGTVYEEQYLMESLQKLRDRIVKMKEEVDGMMAIRSTFAALIQRMGDPTLSDDLLSSSRVIPLDPSEADKVEKEDKQKYRWQAIPV